nr:hypothetical protein [Tanacetum cinerariifolium]
MVVLGVNKPQSDEDRLKLNELMELCTTLQSRILDLEKTKTTQALEIDSLKSSEELFVAKQDENVVKKEVDAAQIQVSTAVTTPTILIDEVTLAQALAELKHRKT